MEHGTWNMEQSQTRNTKISNLEASTSKEQGIMGIGQGIGQSWLLLLPLTVSCIGVLSWLRRCMVIGG